MVKLSRDVRWQVAAMWKVLRHEFPDEIFDGVSSDRATDFLRAKAIDGSRYRADFGRKGTAILLQLFPEIMLLGHGASPAAPDAARWGNAWAGCECRAIATDWQQSLAMWGWVVACYADRPELKECIMAKENQRGFADILAEAVGKAVTDIRQHVVEEPWFGQVLREFPGRDSTHDQAVDRDAAIENEIDLSD